MLHPLLLNALYMRNFIEPTPIQRRTLPSALKGKDVVGVAETVYLHVSFIFSVALKLLFRVQEKRLHMVYPYYIIFSHQLKFRTKGREP